MVEAEATAHQRPGHIPEPTAPPGAAGLEGLPLAPGLLETVSSGHDLSNPQGHDESALGIRVNGPRAPLVGTGVLTKGQRAILDAVLGGLQPNPALPTFHQTLLVQEGPTLATLEEARASPEAAHWDAALMQNSMRWTS